jgi:hypothetical protein
MGPDTWASLGAGGLLIAASVAQGLALLKVRPGPRLWELLVIGARLGGTVALAISLAFATVAHGEWSPSDLRQVTLGLAVATLVVHLILAWRLGIGSAGLVVDVVVIAFILLDATAIQPGGPRLSCAQRAVPYRVQWVLLLLGSGGAVAAGSAGLMRGLYACLTDCGRGLRLPPMVDVEALLKQATALVLLFLGSGIVVSAWWAWQTVGSLADDDPRVAWVAIAWLVAAMSKLVWRLDKHPLGAGERGYAGRWAASLAVIAAAAAIFGLLAVADLRRLLGM